MEINTYDKEKLDKFVLNDILLDVDILSSNFTDVNHKINQIDKNIKQLPPIATYYNNKMIEIYHEIKNKNCDYAHSDVNIAAASYLTGIMKQAAKTLEKYVEANKSKISLAKRLMNKSVGQEYLEEYKNLCNQILDFSLEKDAVKAINYNVDKLSKLEWYGDVNKNIFKYNKELEALNIPDRVAYREDNKQKQTEINEDDLEKVTKMAQAEIKKQNQLLEKNKDLFDMINEIKNQKDLDYNQDNQIQK